MKLEYQSCWSCESCLRYPVDYNVDFYCLLHEQQAEKNGWCSEWQEREEKQGNETRRNCETESR